MVKRIYYSAFSNVIKREVNRISNNWILWFITLIAPIIAYLTIMWMFSDGVIRDVPISVVDLDGTNFSRNIVRQVDATPATKIAHYALSVEEAKTLMDKGKIDAIVVIPNGAEKNILTGSFSNIALYINNTNVVKGGAIKSGLYKTLSTLSAGIKVQTNIKKGLSYEQAIERALLVR